MQLGFCWILLGFRYDGMHSFRVVLVSVSFHCPVSIAAVVAANSSSGNNNPPSPAITRVAGWCAPGGCRGQLPPKVSPLVVPFGSLLTPLRDPKPRKCPKYPKPKLTNKMPENARNTRNRNSPIKCHASMEPDGAPNRPLKATTRVRVSALSTGPMESRRAASCPKPRFDSETHLISTAAEETAHGDGRFDLCTSIPFGWIDFAIQQVPCGL